jgi:ADP-ribose pyrophosphatase
MAIRKQTAKASSASKSAAKSAATPPATGSSKSSKVKVLSSRRTFHGKVFDVYSDDIVEPGGEPHIKDVIRHHGSAVILPVQYTGPDGKPLAEPHILLERQYRHATGKYLWEIPAGRLEPGESPLAAAKRELAEETGFRARKWSKLTSYYASPGFLAEKMNMFLAEDLTPGETNLDEDEIIEWEFFPLSKVLRLIDQNRLEDAKTMVATLLFERRRSALGTRASFRKKK